MQMKTDMSNAKMHIIEEMVNMISANRSYEANVTAINTNKSIVESIFGNRSLIYLI